MGNEGPTGNGRRVALLGAAHIHIRDYLGVLRERPDAHLSAVYDPDDGRARRLAYDTGARAAADPGDALDGADLVLICSRTADHAGLIEAARPTGLPLYVEKPLGRDAPETRALAARLAGHPLATGFFLRLHPGVRRLRALLAGGALGALSGVHARYAHDGAVRGWFTGEQSWMLDRAQAGPGGFGDDGIHLMDLLPWLIPGAARLTTLGAAIGSNAVPETDDHGTALLTTDAGLPVTVSAGWATAPAGLRLTVTGATGTAVLDGGRLTLSPADGPARVEHDGPPPTPALALHAFLDAPHDGETGDAAARLVAAAELVDAAYLIAWPR
ncbi:Gfo/Idh/MocA family protein [Bailinhaonella thermotolerans]|uniref:Gfo/Idh/MocA family oxidoreductase n=1 Tax=Bailinhaonella thermotolerans TaxID=1070861 RepID=A0A3A4B9V5_9ACTN|nr:Gfo/Idh/MocA family oxidoreductase [Bailinhaonella thermotolerans]RJL35343.1 gfo/Idh/MocA family oxidoreductase [Bailinhaonella thermotolerans]